MVKINLKNFEYYEDYIEMCYELIHNIPEIKEYSIPFMSGKYTTWESAVDCIESYMEEHGNIYFEIKPEIMRKYMRRGY